jgi:hypothetical protein
LTGKRGYQKFKVTLTFCGKHGVSEQFTWDAFIFFCSWKSLENGEGGPGGGRKTEIVSNSLPSRSSRGLLEIHTYLLTNGQVQVAGQCHLEPSASGIYFNKHTQEGRRGKCMYVYTELGAMNEVKLALC